MPVTKKTCFHPYTKATVNQVERWLLPWRSGGGRFVSCGGGSSFFENQLPRARNSSCFGVWTHAAATMPSLIISTQSSNIASQARRSCQRAFRSLKLPLRKWMPHMRAKDARNAYFQHFHVQLLIAALLLAAAEFLLYFVLEAVDTAMFVFLTSVFLAAALYYLVSVLMLRNARKAYKAYVRRRT